MSKERPSNEVLEQYYREKKDREKRIELDAEVRRISRENNKKAQESLKNKLNLIGSLQKNPSYKHQPVREERKRLAAKYMDKGITEILQAERKTSNLLTVAKDDVERFLQEEARKYIKAQKADEVTGEYFKLLSDEEQESRAERYLASVLKYGTCATEAEKAMKQKYNELRVEVARCNNEAIAVQMAKDTFLEDNADIIEEAQKERRKRDLMKSGLLENLGILEKVEKSEEDNEE